MIQEQQAAFAAWMADYHHQKDAMDARRAANTLECAALTIAAAARYKAQQTGSGRIFRILKTGSIITAAVLASVACLILAPGLVLCTIGVMIGFICLVSAARDIWNW